MRALIIGPVFPTEAIGGLQLALNDVAEQLRKRGWEIDSSIYPSPAQKEEDASSVGALRTTLLPSRLTPLQRWRWLTRLSGVVPKRTRLLFYWLSATNHYFKNVSDNLSTVETILTKSPSYDVVMQCANGSPPGLTKLLSVLHDRVVVISLSGLGTELGNRWWTWMKLLAPLRLRGKINPFLFRRVAPQEVRLAVFASQQWKKEAVKAGLPERAARVIYFGVLLPEPLPRSPEVRGRLLWVGRLSPAKGLHLLLPALPTIREQVAGVTLTVIAAPGEESYHNEIHRIVRRYELGDVVTFHQPVTRTALQHFYSEHDVLLFHSIFAEPVALVLMEAFAAGLPVVASQAKGGSQLVQDGITCLCYQPHDRASLVAAVVRMLTDTQLRLQLGRNAQKLVRQEFSLDAMGDAYDRLLRQFVLEQK